MFWSHPADRRPLRIRPYDITTDRETAAIRGRLMRGIRAGLRVTANSLFRHDAKAVGDSGAMPGWRNGPGGKPAAPENPALISFPSLTDG
jgi:hypothetical protein